MMNKISPVIKVDDVVLMEMHDILKNRQKLEVMESFYSNDLILWMKNKKLLNKEIDLHNKELSCYYKLLYGEKYERKFIDDENEFLKLINKFSREFQSKEELEEECRNVLKYEVFLIKQSESDIKKWFLKFSDNVYMFALIIYYMDKNKCNEVYNKFDNIIRNFFNILRGFKIFTVEEINESKEINNPFILLSVGEGTIVEIIAENQLFKIDKNNFYQFKNKIFEKSKVNMINPKIFSEIRIIEVDYVLK